MATVTCKNAIGRFVDVPRAEAVLVVPPGGTPLDNCDWNTTGATPALPSASCAHASRLHGLDIDSLKPELRERVLAAIAAAIPIASTD